MGSAVTTEDVARLEARVERLEEKLSEAMGLIQSLVVSVEFNDKEPFARECAVHFISGVKQAAVQMQIAIMETRMKGQPVDTYPDTMFGQFPSVVAAKRQEFSSMDDMAESLAPLVGSRELAKKLVVAYRQRGLGQQ
ncbi:hypothetical protein [Micrococcus lylae]|uniref:Mediator complex subunit 11 n=2 Tax=Micrococcus lylae TaxID=1273 RepID=A0ABY2K0E0_9MICC|nr:hypothetical protein [Micrococcus lylae]TFH99947.1 hypothetical protein E4A49_04180 [Micrococcus lylae]